VQFLTNGIVQERFRFMHKKYHLKKSMGGTIAPTTRHYNAGISGLSSPSYSAGLEFELTGVAQSAELA
jgi:hypothetical protein